MLTYTATKFSVSFSNKIISTVFRCKDRVLAMLILKPRWVNLQWLFTCLSLCEIEGRVYLCVRLRAMCIIVWDWGPCISLCEIEGRVYLCVRLRAVYIFVWDWGPCISLFPFSFCVCMSEGLISYPLPSPPPPPPLSVLHCLSAPTPPTHVLV